MNIHSLDKMMLGQHCGSSSRNSPINLGYLHTPSFSRAKLRLESSFSRDLRDLLWVSGWYRGFGGISRKVKERKRGEEVEISNKTRRSHFLFIGVDPRFTLGVTLEYAERTPSSTCTPGVLSGLDRMRQDFGPETLKWWSWAAWPNPDQEPWVRWAYSVFPNF